MGNPVSGFRPAKGLISQFAFPLSIPKTTARKPQEKKVNKMMATYEGDVEEHWVLKNMFHKGQNNTEGGKPMGAVSAFMERISQLQPPLRNTERRGNKERENNTV